MPKWVGYVVTGMISIGVAGLMAFFSFTSARMTSMEGKLTSIDKTVGAMPSSLMLEVQKLIAAMPPQATRNTLADHEQRIRALENHE
jgi:hypothetical protein